MEKWKKLYNSRLRSVEEAIENIQQEQTIFLAAYCSEPQTLIEELVRQKHRICNATLYINVAGSPMLYARDENISFFNIKALLSNYGLKHAMGTDHCDYVPVNLSDIPILIEETRIDVALIQVSPPDSFGYCSLGISVDATHTLISNARFVIAEVNEQMPNTNGETKVRVADIDCFVHTSRPLLTIEETEIGEVEQKIGEYVASIIPDGSTLQWGIGNIPNSILYSLTDKKDLGVHSGSITDPVIELIERGVITNRFKAIKPGKVVSTTLLGTEKLIKYADNNSEIEFYPVTFTHNINVISKLENFYSINSALEVDLSGQVNAESIQNRTIAGVGGQMDFILGARYSKGGKSIIAIPSVTKNGNKSRIQGTVEAVTSLKSNVDYVVTEYGIAKLFGKSLKERSEALLSIAHPNFRDELKSQSQL
jgi:4-hydroxybutyrate CoA-transferase